MKSRRLNLRLSEQDYQKIIGNALLNGDYCKLNGEINLSKFCLDQSLKNNIKIIKIEGVEKIPNLHFQVRKIGQNFNQLMNQIHIERSGYSQNGYPSEAVLNKYDVLGKQYNELQRSLNSIRSELDLISRTIEIMT